MDSSNGTEWDLVVAVVLLSAVVLGPVAWLQVRKDRGLTRRFIKMFGLLAIAAFALLLAVLDIDSDARTAAFTLLGTIAGYLAGSSLPDQENGE